MADSQEEFTIVPNSKAKAAIWRHFGVKKRKADGSIAESCTAVVCFIACEMSSLTCGLPGNATPLADSFGRQMKPMSRIYPKSNYRLCPAGLRRSH
ncbi:hypothetical protein BaRGS_00016515 [Batillaria attramentaria]|uniref:Uncharacterized protein n=1 Tax=Batillaria attramentaria TaxID=370345 RepID=A0ABD0KY55_9CAEN